MRKSSIAVFILMSAVVLNGCASSGTNATLLDSYRAPGTLSFVFERGVAFVMNGGPELRAQLENEIVRASGAPRMVTMSTVLPGADMRSVPILRQKLLDQNYDGLLTMRLLRADELDPVVSQPGESLSTYADNVAPGEPAFGQGKVRIETTIYRLSDEKMVWRGIVEGDASQEPVAIVRNAVLTMAGHLRKNGLYRN